MKIDETPDGDEILVPQLPKPKQGELEAMRARANERKGYVEELDPRSVFEIMGGIAKEKGVDLKKVIEKPSNTISLEDVLSDIEVDFEPFVIPKQRISYEDAKLVFVKVMKARIKQQGFKYVPCPKQGEIIKYLIKYFIDDQSSIVPLNNWIVLVGNTGTGKTFLMDCIGYMCDKLQLRKRFIKKEAMYLDEEVKNGGYSVILKNCSNTMFFNDVGMDDINSKNYGNHNDTFEKIFFTRNEKYETTRQLTFVTSNLSKEDFLQRYGKRIGGRLERSCTFIDFSTTRKIQDFRQL